MISLLVDKYIVNHVCSAAVKGSPGRFPSFSMTEHGIRCEKFGITTKVDDYLTLVVLPPMPNLLLTSSSFSVWQ